MVEVVVTLDPGQARVLELVATSLGMTPGQYLERTVTMLVAQITEVVTNPERADKLLRELNESEAGRALLGRVDRILGQPQ